MSNKKDYIEREAAVAFLENMAASRYLIQCFENKEKYLPPMWKRCGTGSGKNNWTVLIIVQSADMMQHTLMMERRFAELLARSVAQRWTERVINNGKSIRLF